MQADTPSIVWFRRDLRTVDNPALRAAAERGGPVIPLFVLDIEADTRPGGASRWWLHRSLAALDKSLRGLGSRLVLRQGSAAEVLPAVIQRTGARHVFWNRRYEPGPVASDSKLKAALENDGVQVRSFAGSLLFEPWQVRTKAKGPFKVFTPFWNACLLSPEPRLPAAAPSRLPAPRSWPRRVPLASLKLEPKIDWAAGLRQDWRPGEASAREELERFLASAASSYSQDRDRPDRNGTSRLSPYLHFGEISPHQVWHAIRETAKVAGGANAYLRQLGWREFAAHLLFHYPHTVDQPLREALERFPGVKDAEALRAWQHGRTGYPIVDAGMRQLWRTGWMHNRVRMIVASFLVKDLLISWHEGARWFWDTLVDADLANNTLGWQWVAGCGADAAPYFRIFNPVSQGKKLDPDGAYVRRWAPEIAALPNRWIHSPWEAPAAVLQDAGVELGKTYPTPMVDHAERRKLALEAYHSISMRQTA
jgi:deoxyribodipyrimidine photo-lyase